ncbi:hypothetical protein HYZ97_05035 [Candidatus Pacearchaeota archaeon]|nr:hypothetical protein [Candidatus Pacearchaeota archaeon]
MFSKRGDEFIDYTLLQKRGLLKQKEQALQNQVGNDGMLDLTASSPTASSGNPFDMLSTLASSSPSSTPSALPTGSPDLEVQGLKNKLEDVEYKLERLMERLMRIDSRLDELGSR